MIDVYVIDSQLHFNTSGNLLIILFLFVLLNPDNSFVNIIVLINLSEYFFSLSPIVKILYLFDKVNLVLIIYLLTFEAFPSLGEI